MTIYALFSDIKMSRCVIFSLYLFNYGTLQTATNHEELINVYNMSNSTIYVATYCDTPITGSSSRTSTIYTISSDNMVRIPRPAGKLTCTRNLRFSYHKSDLIETLDKKSTVGSVGIGATTGGRLSNSFYIIPLKGVLHGYSALALKGKDILLKITAMLKATVTTVLKSSLDTSLLLKDNPHADESAQVRIGSTVPEEEAAFVQRRKIIVQQALEKFLGRKLNGSYIPTIACINSGGGARALIGALGFHVGLEQIGLLDAIMYDVGLSGGSWFVSLWHQSNSSPALFKRTLQPIVAKGIDPTRAGNITFDDAKQITQAVAVRKASHQPTSFVTLYGAMLANHYLMPYKPRTQATLFSSLYARPDWIKRPFPIIAAVDGHAADIGKTSHIMGWFEISPVEASGVGPWLGDASIATWSLGRHFENNVSIDMSPEYDMGQLMGICGSAFAGTLGRAFAQMPYLSVPLHYVLKATIGEEFGATKRISVGKIPNFTQHIADSTIRHKKDLRLVDAAMAFNIPVPIVLHAKRKADIIIIFDMSGDIEITRATDTLGLTEKYAQHHGLLFPKISYDTVSKQALSIFSEENNADVPMVLYMPRIVDRTHITYPSFIPKEFSTILPTLQFQYDAQEFNNLSGVTEANIVGSKQQISDAITRNIELHKGFAE